MCFYLVFFLNSLTFRPQAQFKGSKSNFFFILWLFFEVLFDGTGSRYFFLCFLTSRLQRKHPSNLVIDSHIIFKKCRTGVLRHSLKGPNPFFFYYLLLFFFLVFLFLLALFSFSSFFFSSSFFKLFIICSFFFFF